MVGMHVQMNFPGRIRIPLCIFFYFNFSTIFYSFLTGNCGVSKYSDAGSAPSAQVVGGWDARPNEFPWQISMHRLKDSSFQF